MLRRTQAHPTLADLTDLAARFQHDAERDELALRHRDRPIGQTLAHLRNNPPAQMLAWLERIRETDPLEEPGAGRAAAQAQQLIGLLLTIAGWVLGSMAAAAVFYYDGSDPVNVVRVLAVFVGVQAVLLLGLIVVMLPRGLVAWVPGAEAVQEALQLLSPGRLQALARRLLPAEQRDAVQRVVGRTEAHQRVYGRVQKWTVLLASQGFAAAFNVGALAGVLYLILFSDLAFGWSTTLQVDAAAFHRLTDTLALPWAWLWPDAVPTIELIEATRYFRIGQGVFGISSGEITGGTASGGVKVLGGWWPFLVACMVVYGLLPRVVTLMVARWRLQAALRDAVVRIPGAAQLLDRLNSELIETRASTPEAPGPTTPAAPPASPSTAPTSSDACLVNWAGVPMPDAEAAQLVSESLGVRVSDVVHAGGARSLAEDAQAIRQLREHERRPSIVILVKAWEPPLMEFVDFLHDLRAALGDGQPIAVTPVMLNEQGQIIAPTPVHSEQWRRKMQAAGDPWLRVSPLRLGEEAA